jgi:hypothetical protein
MYDSREDTRTHIFQVQICLGEVIENLERRAVVHDASKLEEPELSVFNEYTPKLAETTYGSEEYKEFLKGMGVGLAHHYEVNDHHPEHFQNGLRDMSLLQITEMLCDWKAATLRHKDGDLRKSIEQNAERFGYDETLKCIFMNTAFDLGWL